MKPLADKIEHLRQNAGWLDEKAREDGVLPDREGQSLISPQTGAAP